MFRQIVATTWASGVTDAQKHSFVDALFALRAIPGVAYVHGGIDCGRFPDNYGAVSILEFADFDAARAYVDHPDHQAYIADLVRPLTEGRVVVQYEWGEGDVAGFHHVKLPVSDVARSRDFYIAAFGFESQMDFVEDGELRGASLHHPASGIGLSLRGDAERARAMAGFDMIALAVGTRDDLAVVSARAEAAGATVGEVMQGQIGWARDVTDPDGLIVRLYTYELSR
jgi:catechol 2,3-dioxygenase-like lactoylglutathione lyase family enzyme